MIIHNVKGKIKYLFHFIYSKQVKFEFPMSILVKYIGYEWQLPEGYSLVSPNKDTDLREWAELLNREGGFGIWTPERVKAEIVDHMISPDAASLLYYKGSLVGCGSAIDQSRKGRKVGIGMWLYLEPAHRGAKGLAHAVVYRTASVFAEAGYDQFIGYTDRERLSVLYLHLKDGCVPLYDSLSSIFKWHRILKKLKPLLDRAEKRAQRGSQPKI